MSLIEIVVMIAVLGVVGTMAGSIVVSMSQSYVDNRIETGAELHLRIALLHIEREIKNAHPDALEIAPQAIRFKSMIAGGGAEALGDGYLFDESQAKLAAIAPGMKLAFAPVDARTNLLAIRSVDAGSQQIRAAGITDQMPKTYVVFDAEGRIVLNGANLILEKQSYAASDADLGGMLCDNITSFDIRWVGGAALQVSLTRQGANEPPQTLSKIIALRNGNI